MDGRHQFLRVAASASPPFRSGPCAHRTRPGRRRAPHATAGVAVDRRRQPGVETAGEVLHIALLLRRHHLSSVAPWRELQRVGRHVVPMRNSRAPSCVIRAVARGTPRSAPHAGRHAPPPLAEHDKVGLQPKALVSAGPVEMVCDSSMSSSVPASFVSRRRRRESPGIGQHHAGIGQHGSEMTQATRGGRASSCAETSLNTTLSWRASGRGTRRPPPAG